MPTEQFPLFVSNYKKILFFSEQLADTSRLTLILKKCLLHYKDEIPCEQQQWQKSSCLQNELAFWVLYNTDEYR